MKLYAAFDDTDVIDAEFGTGKLVRMLKPKLPEGIHMAGVVRHQLLVADGIPYTSHNSPACAILELEDPELMGPLIEVAASHIEALSSPGSDPGLCVALADQVTQALVDFGHGAGIRKVTQDEARTAAQEIWFFWLPRRLSFVIFTTLRFLPLLLRDAREIYALQILRGARVRPRDLLNPVNWSELAHSVAIPLLVRTVKISGEVAASARVRGIADCEDQQWLSRTNRSKAVVEGINEK